VKYYGNSAVSYVKRYGVVNTVRRAVDTINTKLRSAGQKIYTSVNNFLQNQYSKIEKSVVNSTNALGLAPVGFFMGLGITAGASEFLSGVLVGSFISRHPVVILAGLTFVGTFVGGYIICETFNRNPRHET